MPRYSQRIPVDDEAPVHNEVYSPTTMQSSGYTETHANSDSEFSTFDPTQPSATAAAGRPSSLPSHRHIDRFDSAAHKYNRCCAQFNVNSVLVLTVLCLGLVLGYYCYTFDSGDHIYYHMFAAVFPAVTLAFILLSQLCESRAMLMPVFAITIALFMVLSVGVVASSYHLLFHNYISDGHESFMRESAHNIVSTVSGRIINGTHVIYDNKTMALQTMFAKETLVFVGSPLDKETIKIVSHALSWLLLLLCALLVHAVSHFFSLLCTYFTYLTDLHQATARLVQQSRLEVSRSDRRFSSRVSPRSRRNNPARYYID